jgi:nitrogen fixation/metabolism regulation signal transduction histidine kinase
MDYSHIRLQITIRVIALALTLYLLMTLANGGAYALTVILVVVLSVVQVISLIRFLDRTHSDIYNFFEAIKNNDFSDPFEGANGGAYHQYLRSQFLMVIEKIKNTRLAKDERLHYLTTIVQHVGIGLITFNDAGKVQIVNIAAKRLLKIDHLKNIDELEAISAELVATIKKLKTGGRELLTIESDGDERNLSIYAIELTLGKENFKLVSLQNIRTELEEKEMEAWQKLVRVLTHEIMNSVTPISSLATTVQGELVENLDKNDEDCVIAREELEDIHLAVQTIQRRSEGLIRFVNDFRSLTHTPEPKFQMVSIVEMLEELKLLAKHDLEANNIQFTMDVKPANLAISIDPELIQQVLINLVKNATQALSEIEERKIEVKAFQEKGHTLITVKDNGPGIDEEAQTKIFIPFFTTKRSGSGIGLSLSRQIMRQHGGSISVRSKIDEGSEFILRF